MGSGNEPPCPECEARRMDEMYEAWYAEPKPCELCGGEKKWSDGRCFFRVTLYNGEIVSAVCPMCSGSGEQPIVTKAVQPQPLTQSNQPEIDF